MCDKHDFFFELDKAFTGQFLEKFKASPSHALSKDVGSAKQGVYLLYRQNKAVYAGKAEKNTTLKRRLNEHRKKIEGRKNISVDDMTCRFLAIDSDWFVRAGEQALMTHFAPEWNKSGIGSHDPGVGRPGTHRKSKFDTMFPPK